MRSANFLSTFLEREGELQALEKCLREAAQGTTGFVPLSAEAGAGKSRLVEELRRRNAGQIEFLCGRAYLATATTPYAVWVDALDFHLRSLRRRDLLHVMEASADLRRLFPSLSTQFEPSDDARRDADMGWERTRLFGQMAALITRLTTVHPVVIVLDNLQWADASSIELLHSVVRGIQGSKVLIVGLYRGDEIAPEGALHRCVESLEHLGFVERLTLPALSLAATSAIVTEGTGLCWPGVAVSQLHLLTQGNALFIWEMVKHAAARNGGQPFKTELAQRVLPDSIGSLIQERLRDLDDDARRVLAFSAAIEAPISYPLLQAVTGFDEERLLNVLDELTGMRFLDEIVTGSEVAYEFHKPLIQAAIYQGMGVARRQFLHRVIASELMKAGAGRPVEAATIARHLVSGAAEGRQEGALPYLLQAAQDAVALFGNHEAIALLATALRVAGSSPAANASLYDLYLNLGESYKRLGDFKQAVQVWSKSLLLGTDAQRAFLRRCMARALWQAGEEVDAIGQLRQGIQELASARDSVEGNFLRQEYALSKVRQGDLQGALHEAAGLLASIDEERQPELVARVYIVICLAQGYRGDMRAAFQAGAKALALSESLPYPGAAYLAHYTLADLLRYDGDFESFESHCHHCSDIAARMHAVALESWPLSIQIERRTLRGQLEEAIALGVRAIAIDESIAQGTILPRSHAFLAVAYRLAGDGAKARHHLDQSARFVENFHKTEMQSFVIASAAAAYVDFLDEHYRESFAGLGVLLQHLGQFEPLGFYALHPYVLPLAAEAAARMGSETEARAMLADIRRLQRGAFRPAEGTFLHVEGLLQLLAGNAVAARASFEKAVIFWDRVQRPYDAARARVDLANALERSGEAELAVHQLNLAGNGFNGMAAAKEVAIISQRLRRQGQRPAFGAQRRVIGQKVSARESEVIDLVATGKTNKEIASELFLSELTIETHVRNILRKLSLKSRYQIARYALQRDPSAAGEATQAIAHAAGWNDPR